MELLTPEGLRMDGRRPKEMRQVACQLGVLPHADGSAKYSAGNTCVVAAVFGPGPLERGGGGEEAVVRCELSVAAFASGERRQRAGRTRLTLELARAVEGALRHLILAEAVGPRTVTVALQVLQSDGGLLAAAINAAVAAVVQAGVPVRDLAGACTCARLEGAPALDLNHLEELGAGPGVTLAAYPLTQRVAFMQAQGRQGVEGLEEVSTLCLAGCKAVSGLLRAALMERTQRLAAQRNPQGLPQPAG